MLSAAWQPSMTGMCMSSNTNVVGRRVQRRQGFQAVFHHVGAVAEIVELTQGELAVDGVVFG